MAKFYPLYARRSDGKLEMVVKGKKERNEPTKEQLDKTPDKNGVSDYYREVLPDDIKHLDWRRKLGGMLARELISPDKFGKDTGFILAVFPEGYRLYEHVKRTEKDGKTEVKNKNHAAGTNDRQDAYLYGHPIGKKKRFRSPHDFFPHLLWLCTDDSADPDNCTCKMCCPDDLEHAVPTTRLKPATPKEAARNLSVQSQQAVRQSPSVAPPSEIQNPPRQNGPTPVPAPTSQEQVLDRQYNKFMYRPGEVVWFNRAGAWGLGAILQRWEQSSLPHYNVQPLSFPAHAQRHKTISGHENLRPWLAFSVPQFSNEELNLPPQPRQYESINWSALLRNGDNGDVEVDASILAAEAIDATFTPFGLARSDGSTKHYLGLFLGAEKIWLGDPIRLRTGPGTDMMVVKDVIEQNGMPQPSVTIVGDVFRLQTSAHRDPNLPTPAAPQSNLHLPQRINEDLAFRNAQSVKMKQTATFWKLQTKEQHIPLEVIKGRWYEASLLLPYLQPNYRESYDKGEIQESSLWMNARGDWINSHRTGPPLAMSNIKKQSRLEALGRAVPSDIEIREGVQPPAVGTRIDPDLNSHGTTRDVFNIDPSFDTADSSDGLNNNGLDEFMNLDGGGFYQS